MNLFKIFVLYLVSICPLFQESVQTFQADYFYLSFCPSVHCQKTWVDFHVRLFLSVHLSICPSVYSVKEGGRLSCQIIFICPSVHSFKRGGRLSSQYISICPSVHLSILSREGQTFQPIYFICPSVHLSILSREGVDFLARLFLSVRLSICPLSKNMGRLSFHNIHICLSVHLSNNLTGKVTPICPSVHS